MPMPIKFKKSKTITELEEVFNHENSWLNTYIKPIHYQFIISNLCFEIWNTIVIV